MTVLIVSRKNGTMSQKRKLELFETQSKRFCGEFREIIKKKQCSHCPFFCLNFEDLRLHYQKVHTAFVKNYLEKAKKNQRTGIELIDISNDDETNSKSQRKSFTIECCFCSFVCQSMNLDEILQHNKDNHTNAFAKQNEKDKKEQSNQNDKKKKEQSNDKKKKELTNINAKKKNKQKDKEEKKKENIELIDISYEEPEQKNLSQSNNQLVETSVVKCLLCTKTILSEIEFDQHLDKDHFDIFILPPTNEPC